MRCRMCPPVQPTFEGFSPDILALLAAECRSSQMQERSVASPCRLETVGNSRSSGLDGAPCKVGATGIRLELTVAEQLASHPLGPP